jgi:hypothetical protein
MDQAIESQSLERMVFLLDRASQRFALFESRAAYRYTSECFESVCKLLVEMVLEDPSFLVSPRFYPAQRSLRKVADEFPCLGAMYDSTVGRVLLSQRAKLYEEKDLLKLNDWSILLFLTTCRVLPCDANGAAAGLETHTLRFSVLCDFLTMLNHKYPGFRDSCAHKCAEDSLRRAIVKQPDLQTEFDTKLSGFISACVHPATVSALGDVQCLCAPLTLF